MAEKLQLLFMLMKLGLQRSKQVYVDSIRCVRIKKTVITNNIVLYLEVKWEDDKQVFLSFSNPSGKYSTIEGYNLISNSRNNLDQCGRAMNFQFSLKKI